MSFKKRWIGIVVASILMYLFLSGNRGLWQLYKFHREKQVLTAENTQLKIEISNYQSEYQSFDKNPAILEKRAREELNLVKPDEVVYKFSPSSR